MNSPVLSGDVVDLALYNNQLSPCQMGCYSCGSVLGGWCWAVVN